MAIRIRIAKGKTMALCAAETKPEEGDLYLDDNIHHALSQKFHDDFVCEGLIEGDKIAFYTTSRRMSRKQKQFIRQLEKDYSDNSNKPMLKPQNNREYWLFTEIWQRCKEFFEGEKNDKE